MANLPDYCPPRRIFLTLAARAILLNALVATFSSRSVRTLANAICNHQTARGNYHACILAKVNLTLITFELETLDVGL